MIIFIEDVSLSIMAEHDYLHLILLLACFGFCTSGEGRKMEQDGLSRREYDYDKAIS